VVEGVALLILQGHAGSLPRPYEDWEWHQDPGYTKALSYQTKLSSDQIPFLRDVPRKRLVRYKRQYCTIDARNLVTGVIYKSDVVNGVLGGFFFLSTKMIGRIEKRYINYIQTTSKRLPDHSFSIRTIQKIMDGHNLFDEANKNVEINLVCLVDRSNANVKGCKFTTEVEETSSAKEMQGDDAAIAVDSKETPTTIKKPMTIEDLRKNNDFKNLKNRFNSYIVRTDIYNIPVQHEFL
jgi:hypothetical protein